MIPDIIRQLAQLLSPKGELRIVGGAVRNHLMGCGNNTTDFDLAINCPSADIIPLLSAYKCNFNGLKFGVLAVNYHHHYLEIASLREDIATDGRRAIIAYTKDWRLDAIRRDFTINSLYMDMNGIIYDYCQGLYDFNPLTLKFIGDPQQRINEDYLRYLRFYRFISQFNIKNPIIPENIQIDPARWLQLSTERIEREIKLLLLGQNYQTAIALAQQDGLFLLCGMMLDSKNCQKLAQYTGLYPDSLLIKQMILFPTWQARTLGKQWQQHQQIIRENLKNHHYFALFDLLTRPLFFDLLFMQLFHDAINLRQYHEITQQFAPMAKIKFPLHGHDLPFHGQELGQKLQLARQIWYNSGYKIGKKALCDALLGNQPISSPPPAITNN